LEIPIEIETQDKLLLYEMFDVNESNQGIQIEPVGSVFFAIPRDFSLMEVGISGGR
jgi:hypothetical protein